MATYSSSSNPFIKLNDRGSPKKQRAVNKKDAPGMAKPESCLVNPNAETLLMNINNDNTSSISNLISNTNKINGKLHDNPHNNELNCLEDLKVISEELEPSCCSSTISKTNETIEVDSLEIAEACESLVEMTVRLELQEKKLDSICNNSRKETNSSSQVFDICDKPLGSKRLQANPGDLTSKNNILDISNEHNNEDENVNDNEDDEPDTETDLGSAPMERDDRRHQHIELIKKLRLQLKDLERYAFERGELDQVPASVIAERQSVILDTLQERLSLNISRDEIERLGLDELKKQVDKEVQELIDPLITKEHLLAQLKTQLTDLERYISHLHGTIGKIHSKKNCSCKLHGCSSSTIDNNNAEVCDSNNNVMLQDCNSQADDSTASLIDDDSLPKSTKLIRSLVTQLICSDIKLRSNPKRENEFKASYHSHNNNNISANEDKKDPRASEINRKYDDQMKESCNPKPIRTQQKFNDNAAWTLHIDRVILATDSLVNLYSYEPQTNRRISEKCQNNIDEKLVESVVRRQLVPAIRDLLAYGTIDPNSMPKPNSYISILFDPYYILSSLTCFPSSQKSNTPALSASKQAPNDKIHVWNIIQDYYDSKNEPKFKSSSAKTLSQSFNLAPSISGPIKITSKQALLIAVEDIIETLSKCKPNGPDSHFRSFIYTALNRKKLSTWLRLIFKNKSVIKKYYFNFSFTSQTDMIDKFLATIEVLSKLDFKLKTDIESIEQFVSAF